RALLPRRQGVPSTSPLPWRVPQTESAIHLLQNANQRSVAFRRYHRRHGFARLTLFLPSQFALSYAYYAENRKNKQRVCFLGSEASCFASNCQSQETYFEPGTIITSYPKRA